MESSPLLGRKILVTGASGFIGSYLVDKLCQGGAEVHGISRVRQPAERRSVQWWTGDLSDIAIVRTFFRAIKPELVFHLAGHVMGGRDLELVLPTFQSSLVTTVNILTAGTELGCGRMILAASLEEPTQNDGIPSSPYAAAKWGSSAYARMFHTLYSVPIILVRPAIVYGPGDARPYKLIPYVIRSLIAGESPKLTAGNRQVDWLYIDDAIDGIVAASTAKSVEGCTIDLASGVITPIRTLVMHLVDILGASVKPSFGALPDRALERVYAADISFARTKLNWEPRVGLNEGLARTVEWHRSQASLPSSRVSPGER